MAAEAGGSASTPVKDSKSIDLGSCPSIFVLPTHLSLDELHDTEESLSRRSAPLTYDISEATWILGKVSQKKRASLELRSRGIWTEEVPETTSEPRSKRRRLATPPSGVQPVEKPQTVDLTAQSETEEGTGMDGTVEVPKKKVLKPPDTKFEMRNFPLSPSEEKGNVRVLKLDWITESLKAGQAQPPEPYTVYFARKLSRSDMAPLRTTSSGLSSLTPEQKSPLSPSTGKQVDPTSRILERAKADAASSPPPKSVPPFLKSRRQRDGPEITGSQKQPPKLYRRTTSEQEEALPLPPQPDWVKNNVMYACLRSAPLHSANDAFIGQLLKIKTARELTLDEIGVRAYSTSISAIAAYPYAIQSPEEVLSLPGCESKIANLFAEWKQSSDGTLEAANQLEADQVLCVLNLFNNIWGVGAKTARDFYYQKQWRSLDDIVEQGWSSLSRVQQIGVKYFDEFKYGVPRADTEHIGQTVMEHARRVRPGSDYDGKGIEFVIVGGYRRGKERSGDVDIVISHRDERVTHNLVYDIVASLEQEGRITHTLALHLTSSNRNQQTLPYRGESHGKPRFDSLDKALVVWQDPHFEAQSPPSSSGHPTSDDEEAGSEEEESSRPSSQTKAPEIPSENPSEKEAAKNRKTEKKKKKSKGDKAFATTQNTTTTTDRKNNPNPHCRVDIIISPWRTVGCAVLGWSGDLTFQRDLRRYAKKAHNWKFDSSGVRAREGSGGRVIDLEDGGDTWEEREKMVMEGLGVGWRPPEERCSR